MKLKRLLLASALALSFVVSTPTQAKADPISAAIVTFIGFTGTAATVATFVINSALYAAGSWAVGKAAQALGLVKSAVAERQASVTTLSLGETPRELIVGQACTGGTLIDAFNFGGKYSTDTVTRCIGLADHEVSAIVGYYVDDRYYPWVVGGVQPGFNGKLSIDFRNAAAAGWAPPLHVVQNGGWAFTDRLCSIAHVWVDTRVDDQVWSQGHPRFRFVINGLKAYDMRKDAALGYTGPNPHVWEDVSTHEFTRNAEVIRYNYQRGIYAAGKHGQTEHLLIGRGLTAEEAPPHRVIAAANLCDEIVDGEPRYTANGVVSAAQSFIDVEEMFAAAMAGVIVQRDGGVEVEPGQAKAAFLTITDADLAAGEPVSFTEFQPDTDGGRINTVVPRYVEPAQGYKDHGGPPRRDLADIQEDGGPREMTLPLMLVTSGKQADRCAEIARRRARLERRASIVLPPDYAEIEEGDWIAWKSDRYHEGGTVRYQVTSYSLDEKWRQHLSLEEIASSVYGVPDPVEDRADPPPAPTPVDALQLTGVTAEAITLAGDTSTLPAIRFRWDVDVADTAMTALRAEVRRQGETDPAPTRFEDVARGEMIATNGVGPDMVLEARLVPIGDPSRPVVPTSWFTLSTAAIVSGDTTHLNGTPVTEITDRLQSVEAVASAAQQGVADLEAVYGDTASAAASAAAAAVDAADAAAAAASATASEQASSASAIAAVSAADDATGAASASAASAQIATTKADESAASAVVATAEKVLAETARSQAQGYATQAADSRDDAEGSAANASASAGLAAASQGAAAGSATAAAGSASTANTKATEAGNSASAALASKVAAESARDGASGSAAAAAVSASSASTSSGQAGDFATAAQGSATTASTKAGEASTFAGQASTSAANAVAASVTAGTAATAAQSVANRLVPDRPSVASDFTLNGAGTPDTRADLSAGTVVTIANEGEVRQITTNSIVFSKGWIAVGAGRTLRVVVRSRLTVDGGSATATAATLSVLDASGTALGSLAATTTQTVASGWQTTTYEATSTQILAAHPNAAFVRARGAFNRTAANAASGATTQVAVMGLYDVTSEVAASAAAATAIAQSSSAGASAASASISANVAAQVGSAALNKNASFAIWPSGNSTPDHIGPLGSGLTISRGIGKVSPNSIIIEAAAGSSNNGVEVAYSAANWNGRMPVVAGAPAYWVIDYKIEIGTGGLSGPMLRFLLTNAATGASLGSTIQKPLSELHTSTGDDQIIEGAHFFRCDLPAASPPASARLALFARAGAVANYNRIIAHKLAVRPATPAEIAAQSVLPEVQASLAITAGVAADAATRLASVRFDVTGGAGGDPFQIWARADASGSAAGLVATELSFASVVGGAVVKAMKVIGGEVFFMRPLYIDVGSKRLIVGPGADWVMWFGPNTITGAAATRINGHWSFGSDGKVYYGSSELTVGGGFSAQSNLGTAVGSRTSAGQVTTAQVDIAIAGATGAVSYAWSQISGDEGWTIVSPSGASTTFRFTVATAGEIRRAAFVCRVVDAGTGKAINITVGAAALYNV